MSSKEGIAFVTFDLYCQYTVEFPAYRIYVDSRLMTERNYRWDNKHNYITERIPLKTVAGPHYLVIENLNKDTAEYEIRNFKINNKPSVYRQRDCRFVLNPTDIL